MVYDSIIIGAGPAGISASLYIKRSNLNVLVLYTNNSILSKAKQIDNYYGTPNISGEELYNIGIKQAKELGVELSNEEVLSVKIEMIEGNIGFKVATLKNEYLTKTVVVSTGASRNTIKVANILDYINTNVSYCATCDGFFYLGKDVAVLGNSEYALNEAKELTKFAKSVTILTNGNSFKLDVPDNIKVNKEKIISFKGTNKIEEIELESTTIQTSGIFIAWGVAGGFEFAKKVGVETKDNKIVVNSKMQTNVPGLYACGDVTGAPYQIFKAVYEGAVAGLDISECIKK